MKNTGQLNFLLKKVMLSVKEQIYQKEDNQPSPDQIHNNKYEYTQELDTFPLSCKQRHNYDS